MQISHAISRNEQFIKVDRYTLEMPAALKETGLVKDKWYTSTCNNSFLYFLELLMI